MKFRTVDTTGCWPIPYRKYDFPVYRVDPMSPLVDREGHEVVNVDGGDMGRPGPDGHALKHLSDGRWLVCIEASSEEKLLEKIAEAPLGWVHFGAKKGFPATFPIYGSSGGVAHAFITYLVYKEKPEEGGPHGPKVP